jgi:hypothetical protein
MELSGEEKKLQALFSEVKAADEESAPRFATVWNRAQIAPRRIRGFNPAFVAATLLLVFGVVAFAVWSRYSRTTPAPQLTVAQSSQAPATTKAPETPRATEAPLEVKPNKSLVASRGNKAATRHANLVAADHKITKDAKTISNWQSPTTALLTSPSDEIFSSVPELNQSATQLKSFLPARAN